MTQKSQQQPIDRFLQTLEIVSREGNHLLYSWRRVYAYPITADWVLSLETKPELAEQLEAFISRFGRMQDTIADKLLPRWLLALAETPGSQIETLNRSEKLGVLTNVEKWLEARQLRNRLIHEYMENEATFAADLLLAQEYSALLIEVFNRLCDFADRRMDVEKEKLPDQLISES